MGQGHTLLFVHLHFDEAWKEDAGRALRGKGNRKPCGNQFFTPVAVQVGGALFNLFLMLSHRPALSGPDNPTSDEPILIQISAVTELMTQFDLSFASRLPALTSGLIFKP